MELKQKEEEEEFVDIEGFEGLYQISNYGRIFSVRFWRFLNTHFRTSAPHTILINHSKEKINIRVKDLVAQHFIPNPNNYRYVISLDKNINNTYHKNLVWSKSSHSLIEDTIEKEIRDKYLEVRPTTLVDFKKNHFPSINIVRLTSIVREVERIEEDKEWITTDLIYYGDHLQVIE